MNARDRSCRNIANAIVQQATSEWKNLSVFRVPTTSGTIPAMGEKPVKTIFRMLKKAGCEVRNNPEGEINWDVRRKWSR